MAMILIVLASEATIATVLFVSAGRMDLPWFWAVIVVHTVLWSLGLLAIDPDLRKERLRPGPGGQSRSIRLVALPMILAHLAVAGMDVGRFGWSNIPDSVKAVALVGYAAGMSFSLWAMVANRYFSPVVRIQSERGHRVVTTGPYRYLRHPGYSGMIVASLCGGIALGSWWSLVPLVPFVMMFLRRTATEDRFLRERLENYESYAERVRYRLVPGLW
jgi:protein-S-isoprenylcysteine O-methyltransferase Ste14